MELVKVVMMMVVRRLGGGGDSWDDDDGQGLTRYRSFSCDELLELN